MWGVVALLLLNIFLWSSDPWAGIVYFLTFALPLPNAREKLVPVGKENQRQENLDQDDEDDDDEDEEEEEEEDDEDDDDEEEDEEEEEEDDDGYESDDDNDEQDPENANEQPEINEPAEQIPDSEDSDEGFVDDDDLEEPEFVDAFNAFHHGIPLYEVRDLSERQTEIVFNRLVSEKTILNMNRAEIKFFEMDIAKKHRSSITEPRLKNVALKCGMCKKNYNDCGNEPKTLNCGHTYCNSCITIAMKFVPFPNEEWHILNCPVCRASTFLHTSMDPVVNEAVVDLIEKLKPGVFKSYLPLDIKLKCPRCNLEYSSRVPKKTPRISIACGHSACDICVSQCIKDFGAFPCSVCFLVVRPFFEIDMVFPKNSELLLCTFFM